MKITTDSTIISFDAWYRFVLGKVYNIDMPIKHEKRDMVEVIKEDEWGDKPLKEMCEIVEPEFDYNFYTDETIELHKLIDPCALIPQDTLKYAIINIIAYICSDLVVDYLREYTKLTGSYVEGVKCRMIMKNEFYFLRALLTANRRNYADCQVLQEGNIIPEGSRLAIMGLTTSPLIIGIWCLNILNCWKWLKLECLINYYKYRKIETRFKMGYAEIKA